MPPNDPPGEPRSSGADLDRLLRRDRRAELADHVRGLREAASAHLRWLVAGGVVVAAALVGWALIGGRGDPPELTLPAASGPDSSDAPGVASAPSSVAGPTTTGPGEVVVHVTGAVNRPGLLHLTTGARVADAIDAAGGTTPDADVDRLNLAEPLVDGSRLSVPRVGEATPSTDAVSATPPAGPRSGSSDPNEDATADAPVDLNTADATALERLPGVGPSTAQAIIDHRDANGPFRSVDDLLDVRGIGPAKLEGLRDLATVGG